MTGQLCKELVNISFLKDIFLTNDYFLGIVIMIPRSLNLILYDFFLWGYLKSKVYKKKATSVSDLKNEITTEVEKISPQMLYIMNNISVQTLKCID